MRLTDTYDPVGHCMRFIAIHVVMLLIDLSDHIDPLNLPGIKLNPLCEILVNVSEVSTHILKLFLDRFSDPFIGALPAFCNCKIVCPGILTIHSWFLQVVCVTDLIDNVFEIFTTFVQKIDVLWILNILRCTCRVKDQCAGIDFFESCSSLPPS